MAHHVIGDQPSERQGRAVDYKTSAAVGREVKSRQSAVSVMPYASECHMATCLCHAIGGIGVESCRRQSTLFAVIDRRAAYDYVYSPFDKRLVHQSFEL